MINPIFLRRMRIAAQFPLVISLLLLISNSTSAQSNTSYNANTIPVGGTFNVALGFQSLFGTTGQGNTAIGYQSLFSNTTGQFNTAVGLFSLKSNTIGSN